MRSQVFQRAQKTAGEAHRGPGPSRTPAPQEERGLVRDTGTFLVVLCETITRKAGATPAAGSWQSADWRQKVEQLLLATLLLLTCGTWKLCWYLGL